METETEGVSAPRALFPALLILFLLLLVGAIGYAGAIVARFWDHMRIQP